MNDTSFDVVGVGANSVDYVYCLPEFPRPDSPAAKLRIARHLVTCGGQTATALCTCASMGLRAKYVGAIGNDTNGHRIWEALVRRGIDLEDVVISSAANPYAVILIDERHGERVVLWDRQPALDVPREAIEAALASPPRLLHVDDTDTGAAIAAARLGRQAGIPVTSDIERVTDGIEELVATVTIPIFDEHVLAALTGERDFERGLRAVRRLRLRVTPADTTGVQMVCVTLGARGAMLLDGDRVHRVEGHQVDAVDTTGAGDVFRGAFIVALLRGHSPADILRFANAAAAISCTRLGAMDGVPTVGEMRALGFRL